jgi:NAD(P)H-dependent flavin oxidoreductase YrpB (nitropropane dioxygenase family)
VKTRVTELLGIRYPIVQGGGAKFEEIRHLVAGTRGRAALQSGTVQDGLVWASMATGLIDDVPTCAEVIDRIVGDCRSRLDTARRYFAA